MTNAARLDHAIRRVVRHGNCSGCGGCTLLDAGLGMVLDEDGFNRPVRRSDASVPVSGAHHIFAQICPGRRMRSARPEGATRHPMLGPVISAWEVWASDPETRHRGSSGGALTALTSWLTASGEVSGFVAAGADAADPRRSVSVMITTKEEALAAAGSRYAPVSALAQPAALSPGTGLVGKPCEVSAARALVQRSVTSQQSPPVLLSFFCAGTPSQQSTTTLLTELGIPEQTPLSDLWYRGRGWPGRFTAMTRAGHEASTSYDQSWGHHLGPSTQWRCKVCPDGVGESGDISAADFWRTDERGYPDFAEGAGCSALLARTSRGHEILQRAFAEGVLVARPLQLDRLAAVQPLQVSRRTTLLGRLVGALLAGRPVPRYGGFGLLRLALGNPRLSVRTARGSYRRVRSAGATRS